jgi:YidC/Oxa1 family membrane protein insertase
MSEKKGNEATLSALLPLLIFGAAAFFFIQYFDKNKKPEPAAPPKLESANDSVPAGEDLIFRRGDGVRNNIETSNYVAIISSRGGRVEKLYLKSNELLKIPNSVIAETGDKIALEKKSLEVTRGNGLDFQPHVYFWDQDRLRFIQMDVQPLNEALFNLDGMERDAKTGIGEIRFSLPVVFKGDRLKITKVYRFLPDDYYFHQITTIQNLESRPFSLGGDLFYKTFGDIGPIPDPEDPFSASRFTRFYNYNDTLTTDLTIQGSGSGFSCSGFGCSSKKDNGNYKVLHDSPDALSFTGSTSKYFFAYSKFLGGDRSKLAAPDGLILSVLDDPTGRTASTAVFKDFRLEPYSGVPVEVGTASGNVDTTGAIVSVEKGNGGRIRESQKRGDAIIIDNMIYFGIRSDEMHNFKNPKIMQAEFGISGPDTKVRDVIYSSGFLALFSAIRDGIVWIMRHLYTVIGNYGWVIIIMATMLKVITWPLNQIQAKSMKRMTEIKPELEKINEKYKNNAQEKQKRTMELYKKYNINPAKGCLPVLIQIPIFIALYSAFSESIELWRSPFALWMTDLSLPDTVYVIEDLFIITNFHINILPIIMVFSQLAQQMLTTVVMDPQQKTILYLMPVMMIFFFWTMPSGVTLYWTVQNIIAIFWQLAVNRMKSEKVT